MDSQKLGSAISRVHKIAKKYGGSLIPSREIERTDRKLLTNTHWLQEVIRGWYMLTRPDMLPGDSTAWYANFWDFARLYLNEKYGKKYCLSAESSLDLHIGNPTIPKQVIAIVEKGGGKPVLLPFNTSILTYSDPNNSPPEQVALREINVMSLPFALCKVSPTFFRNSPLDAEIALRSIKDLQDLSYVLATYNFVRAAERIIGAFQVLKEQEKADFLFNQLIKAGMVLQPVNPFEGAPASLGPTKFRSPCQARIVSLWSCFRPVIVEHFPKPPGLPKSSLKYLNELEELYVRDAYNSLSIEGYQVDSELIQKVHQNNWNLDLHVADDEQRNALAARGYYEAFLEVKKAIGKILKGESPGEIIAKELQQWFQKLFSPNMQVGVLKPSELLGYRRHQVYIRTSRHIPPPKEALLDSMEAFFDCLKNETHPGVRAVLGHFLFVYIHPYMDGNGRLGRFIMNTMLASGGYSWTVIRVENRSRYFSALEKASVEHDILPFTRFVAEEMRFKKRDREKKK